MSVTITRRKNGRYSIGLDDKEFFALYGIVLCAESARKTVLIRLPSDEPAASINNAFKDYTDKVKAKCPPVEGGAK